jgi:hypothetical protein
MPETFAWMTRPVQPGRPPESYRAPTQPLAWQPGASLPVTLDRQAKAADDRQRKRTARDLKALKWLARAIAGLLLVLTAAVVAVALLMASGYQLRVVVRDSGHAACAVYVRRC